MNNYYITFIILNLIIFLNLNRISKFVNIFDFPDKKLKIHKKKTPLLGGTILLINILVLGIYQLIFLKEFLFLEKGFFKIRDITGILFLILSFYFLGLYDDKHNLSPLKKIFFSIVFIIISISLNSNLLVSNFSLSFYSSKIFLENFSIIFTIFCFLILMNSLNFYDGINGQSCIYFLIVFSYLLISSKKYEFYAILIFILLFLLILNLMSRLFLGDNGIYVFSIILSVALIYEHNKYNNIIYADEIFMLLLLPGLDLLRLTITRVLKGKNPFYGDKNHIHHLLLNKFSLLNTNLILIILGIAPIIFFNLLSFNFFLVFFIFFAVYILLIQSLNSDDKKYNHR